MQIVLYSDDVNLLSHWEKSLKEPYVVAESFESLMDLSQSIVVINFSACAQQCEKLLQALKRSGSKALVLHRTPSFQTAQELLKMGASGYGNAMMRGHFLIAALETIKENMIWIYPEFTSQLILGIEPKSEVKSDLLDVLSGREKEVALLLKEGKTYKEVGEILKITPRTIKAHAQHIYTKLGVKDRLALALLLR